MNEPLETLLELLCSTVTKSQSNAQQSLYLLGNTVEAELAHELLSSNGIENKYYANDSRDGGGKLYVQNASIEKNAATLTALIKPATLCKSIKELADNYGESGYQLSYHHANEARQITLLIPLPNDRITSKAAITEANTQKESQSTASKTIPAAVRTRRLTVKERTDEESLLDGPAVARTAIPASMKSSATEEDPLRKRILFYLTGRAFTSGAWMMFILLVLGIIFSITVMVRAFLCPDIVTDARKLPAYCPQKVKSEKQQQDEKLGL